MKHSYILRTKGKPLVYTYQMKGSKPFSPAAALPQAWVYPALHASVPFAPKPAFTKASAVAVHSFSYHYTWVRLPETTMMQCLIEGKQTKMVLTDRRLLVSDEGEQHVFSLERILHIQVIFRRLMGPLLIGGIVGPLAFVGTYRNMLAFWPGIALCCVCMLLGYYGYQGSYQVSIQRKDGTNFQFFIDRQTEALHLFVHYVNNILK
jgi:hypothetical protein